MFFAKDFDLANIFPTLFIPDHFLLNTRDKSENMFVNYNLYRNDIVEIKLFNGG